MQTRVCAALGWFDDDINRTAAISLGLRDVAKA